MRSARDMKRLTVTSQLSMLLFPALLVSAVVGCTAPNDEGEGAGAEAADNTTEALETDTWEKMQWTANPPVLVGNKVVASISYGSWTEYPSAYLFCQIVRDLGDGHLEYGAEALQEGIRPGVHLLSCVAECKTSGWYRTFGDLFPTSNFVSTPWEYLDCPPAGSGEPTGGLPSGGTLYENEAVHSFDGRFSLWMQGDGNMVLYQNSPLQALWATHTAGGGNRAVMRADGDFVVYSSANKPLWRSSTGNHTGASLAVQTDGNVVVYSGSTALWHTGTYGH